ncbi:CLUMA_CG017359, isoform A [Clunio marinus]|uniref:CLUMA_CG017359, isoform A n=1 Tax=Clunio marinus TaxID=568069 RepID=A0A1J1IXF6_9DIPT|nr:CLUMA_CG017359, isoform A [Clunio marinus]
MFYAFIKSLETLVMWQFIQKLLSGTKEINEKRNEKIEEIWLNGSGKQLTKIFEFGLLCCLQICSFTEKIRQMLSTQRCFLKFFFSFVSSLFTLSPAALIKGFQEMKGLHDQLNAVR